MQAKLENIREIIDEDFDIIYLYTECDGGGCSCCFSGSSSEVKLNHFVDREKDPGSVMDWFQMLVVGSATSSTSLQMVIVNHGSLGPGDGTGLEVGSFSVHHEVSLEIVIRVVALQGNDYGSFL